MPVVAGGSGLNQARRIAQFYPAFAVLTDACGVGETHRRLIRSLTCPRGSDSMTLLGLATNS